MQEKLKNCPICGYSEPITGMFQEIWYIQCGVCKTTGPKAPTQEKANASWNTRRAEYTEVWT